MFIDLLWFIVLVILAPYILVGLLLGMVLAEAHRMFRLPVLGAGLAAVGLAAIAWMNSAPDPEGRVASIAEVFGQATPFGLPMPYVCIAAAAALITASYRWDRPHQSGY